MSEKLLCLENVVKRYSNVLALNNATFSLDSGKIVGLLGPNGSGKTTLIKILNGLLTADSGKVEINGLAPGVETKKIVAYLPDNNYLNSYMTVRQIVNFFKDFYDDFRENLAYEMLEKLGISPDTKLKTLSKGNKEKVCLILTMSRNAKLYVLDEPIAGVDPAARDYVIRTIINNYNPEATVLISTHLISDIEQVLDEVIFIRDGSVVLHKSIDEIREEHAKSVDELFREVFRW
ncbi:MAG: ABC transporter ATP-binding protein [Ruminococcaceae bacterium]|nr:ABC transporter ATP-binding protein [Oscillospiraceae bacterium]